jgi:hypothetical protein
MSVTVGTLLIDLRAETASFTSEMSKASQLSARTANDIKRSLEKIAAVGLAMGSAVATGSVALIKSALDSADSLGKLAQASGTTVETLSTLAYAAKLSGVQTDQLGVGLVRLSKAAFAAQGGNVQLERIFGRLGVTVTDSNGHLKDSGVLMQQLAAKFATTADGAGKTAIAVALFGKSGASLIPFLDDYGSRQAKVNEQAHRFGMELSTSTVQVAGEAKEKFAELGAAAQGFGFSVLANTLPALNDFVAKLDSIAEDGKIGELGKAFGQEASRAIHLLGESLDFATRHAEALKIAMGALAGLVGLKIAIPVIGDLQKGGLANVGKAFDGLTKSALGLQRTLPALKEFAVWSKGTAIAVASLAKTEGIATTASLVLTEALTALTVPLIVTGIGALAYAFYKMADSIRMAHDEGVRLGDVLHGLRPVNILKFIFGDQTAMEASVGLSAAKHWTPSNDLDKHKPPPPPPPPKNLFDTSGLGPPQKSPYDNEIRELNQAIAANKAYLSVIDAGPEKIQQVAAAELARAEIVKLNNQLIGEGKAKLTALQEATITQKIATESSLKALLEYGREIVGQQHSTDLSIQQTRALAAANLEGDAAIRRVTVDNAILGLRYNQTTGALTAMTKGLATLGDQLTAKSNIDLIASTNKQIDGLRDQLTERKILTAATLDGIDAQRQAELQVKLFTLDQNIGDTTDPAARSALMQQRDATVAMAKAQWDASDAKNSLALSSPTKQYDNETDSLNHAVFALMAMQKGSLSYGDQLEIVAKQQELFNTATDRTIQLLLGEGSATDGVKAFFLGMQKEAQTTASILYDTFNGAFNKLADGITGIMTAANGYKRRDAMNQMMTSFQDLSKQALDSTLKKGMQSGMGALGNAFGINLGTVGTKLDGSSSSKAFWVRMASDSGAELSNFGEGGGVAGMLGLGKGPGGTPGASSGSSGANVFSSIGGKIASLFGGSSKTPSAQSGFMPDLTAIGLSDLIPESPLATASPDMFANLGGAPPDAGTNTQVTRPGQSNAGGIVSKLMSSVLGMLIPHADGGLVSPNSAYLVGEMGPEILTGASGRILSNMDSQRALSGSGAGSHTFNIDARGSSDPAQVTAQINRALRQAVPQIAAVVFHGVKDQPMRRPRTT